MKQTDALPLESPERVALGGGFVVDLQRARLIDAAGRVVELRPQAFEVLRHLALHTGRLVTKDELMAAVWPGVVVTDDSLVQAIGDIRRALGGDAQRAIRTLPRRGYELIANADAAAAAAPDGSAASQRAQRRIAIGALAAVLAAAGVLIATRRDAAPRPAPAAAEDIRPGAPTLAVLSFEELSADAGGLGAGLGASITSVLARATGLPVLSRRGGRSDAALPASSPAAYELSGTVRREGERLRVTVQLSASGSGRVLWSERYDRPWRELFAVEDQITLAVASALQVKLVDGEQARARVNRSGHLDAWLLAMRGYLRFEAAGRDGYADAKTLFEQALALDPDYAWARALLAATHFLQARFGFAADPQGAMRIAFDEVNAALRLDPTLPDAHSTLGSILLARREYGAALAAGRKAVALGPNDANVHAVLAQTLMADGRWDEAVAASRKAVRLSPLHPAWWLVPDIVGSVFAGRADEAADVALRMLAGAESPFVRNGALLLLGFALVEAGRIDEARRAIAQRASLPPMRGARELATVLFFRDPAHAERYAAALVKAGVPP